MGHQLRNKNEESEKVSADGGQGGGKAQDLLVGPIPGFRDPGYVALPRTPALKATGKQIFG